MQNIYFYNQDFVCFQWLLLRATKLTSCISNIQNISTTLVSTIWFYKNSLILNTIICDMCLQDFACNIFNWNLEMLWPNPYKRKGRRSSSTSSNQKFIYDYYLWIYYKKQLDRKTLGHKIWFSKIWYFLKTMSIE